ncbi:MAG TPA: polysaccharide biosynthesis/export family protein [Pyrinomonadaceae bacterium]|nr:polysaccharide biosynthesis/export family protein [Pyrinomonadaceae bacterium]
MKRVLLLLALALVFCAQGVTALAQSNNIAPAGTTTKDQKTDEQGKPATPPVTAEALPLAHDNPGGATSDAPAKTITTVPGDSPTPSEDPKTKPAATEPEPKPIDPSSVYRVGVGDVLDIRLLNASGRESTLFMVMAGGLLEYPLAGEPVQVAGLTTDEIDTRLTEAVKVYENPQIVVSVREYASHTVIVTGLVNDPGTKVLRREAVPLYVVLAEAQPRPEAGRATIMRPGGQSVEVKLSDSKAMTTLVMPNDVVTLAALPPAPPQFFYIGGAINSPGQKDFHQGMTLTQAVLASGGPTRFAGSKVKVSRQGADGRLVTAEYNLKHVEAGKIPDPLLEAGDRLEVGRGSW